MLVTIVRFIFLILITKHLITACKRCCLAAGATQGNIAYTQNVMPHSKRTEQNMKHTNKIGLLILLVSLLTSCNGQKKDDKQNPKIFKTNTKKI